jgi:tetratricopeptide (TPR) repeat protein
MTEEELTDIETVILRLNKVAMDYLLLENFKDTFKLLKKAENILNNEDSDFMPKRLKLFSITFNNLGCYYKKSKKPLVALSYLQRSLELEIELNAESSALASSHLNICAILSSLKRHEEAIIHSQKATEFLEKARKDHPVSGRVLSNLLISYYNSGVELEYLGKFEESYSHYSQAYSICKELGNNHPMTRSLEATLEKIGKKGRIKEKIHDFSEKGHRRFPSVTPTLPRIKKSRADLTPVRVYTGRNSPYDNLKTMPLKRSL